ncbi:MAG: TauD/TfdA family dioxygenase [Acidocella sp.]|nr:TauD/TfdA family dioxygenase [Acidocella sp.]
MSHIDKRLARYTKLKIQPFNPQIGAVLQDIDLADVSDDTLRHELRQALAEFQVLFIRDQSITVEQQLALAKVFGDPDKAKAFFPRLDGHKEVEIIEKAPGVPNYGTNQWHADITFQQNPPTGTVLYAQKLPSLGGDTAWASATAAYDLVPDALKPYLETLEAVHSFEHSGWPSYFRQIPHGQELYAKARAEYLPVVHKVVQTHPVTGKKILFVNPNFTDKILGLPRQQSDALLAFLFNLFEKPELQARLRWEVGTIAIWDNRATVHYAVTDYTEDRRLHRVTFGEDKAF